MYIKARALVGTLAVMAAATTIGCGKGSTSEIKIDGSSTVFPITEAVAEEFQKGTKSRVTIGVSGTGGGFKKFCNKIVRVGNHGRCTVSLMVFLPKTSAPGYRDETLLHVATLLVHRCLLSG